MLKKSFALAASTAVLASGMLFSAAGSANAASGGFVPKPATRTGSVKVCAVYLDKVKTVKYKTLTGKKISTKNTVERNPFNGDDDKFQVYVTISYPKSTSKVVSRKAIEYAADANGCATIPNLFADSRYKYNVRAVHNGKTLKTANNVKVNANKTANLSMTLPGVFMTNIYYM